METKYWATVTATEIEVTLEYHLKKKGSICILGLYVCKPVRDIK